MPSSKNRKQKLEAIDLPNWIRHFFVLKPAIIGFSSWLIIPPIAPNWPIVGPSTFFTIYVEFVFVQLSVTIVSIYLFLDAYRILGFRAAPVLPALVCQAIGFVFFFAWAYRFGGFAGDNVALPITRYDALYFSVVTWTTLGYGDLKPVTEFRLFAAFEALMGYLYLGLIVGVTVAKTLNAIASRSRPGSKAK